MAPQALSIHRPSKGQHAPPRGLSPGKAILVPRVVPAIGAAAALPSWSAASMFLASAVLSGFAARKRPADRCSVLAATMKEDVPKDSPEVYRNTGKSASSSDTSSGSPEVIRDTGKSDASTAAIEKDKSFWDNLQENPELQEDLKTFFGSLTVALSIRATIVEPRFIPSLSMYPTFDLGDQLTVDKISRNWREYQRRDVVVFYPPQKFFDFAGSDRNGEALIKRIVAIEGDVVEMKDGGKLYVNGTEQVEPFTNERAQYDLGPIKVPPGCVFVLGDNRNASLDGHVWGFLPRENIIGRATFNFWPPWRLHGIDGSPP